MSALSELLEQLRTGNLSERDKGTRFEEVTRAYFRAEPLYRDRFDKVQTYAEWARDNNLPATDDGIDLVATGIGVTAAIQCKFYADDYLLKKEDIDSFFTASGRKVFTERYIVATNHHWSHLADLACADQATPVTRIDRYALEQSQIDWSTLRAGQPPALRPKKSLRAHQIAARNAVTAGLRTQDRGKLLMACGTGKTFTSLKIAEEFAGKGQRVLFLVPSLSLLSQSLTEWSQESETPMHCFAVCSDSEVGKKKRNEDDEVQTFAHELRYPATTEAAKLAAAVAARHEDGAMTVVFSTYHSIEVISRAQKEHGLADFDLIICDEAHRTTGATFSGQEESAFVRVHDQSFVRGNKRLYMTATPRIFGDDAKATAGKLGATLASMDDPALFGKELYCISFSAAVKAGLLCDYKVLVLAIDEAHVNRSAMELLKDKDQSIKVEDAGKIIGCWKALAKQGQRETLADDHHPMRRAVAFCQVIEAKQGGRIHKVSSKKIAAIFSSVVEEYQRSTGDTSALRCEASHVDGSMTATEKDKELDWLKQEPPADTCRILSNVRCLSEGVDVPALDAVLFLTPRNSQIDVVQSVGRVMRKAPGKTRGYVVLPVVLPAGVTPELALNDNKSFAVVWQVLQALRSHDDRFDAMINRIDLAGQDPAKMEVIAVADIAPFRPMAQQRSANGIGSGGGPGDVEVAPQPKQTELAFEIGAVERAIFAKVVQKCGNRRHWEDWAVDIARIAQTHITRIATIVREPRNTEERAAFAAFAEELRDDLNNSISDDEIIEMLAQHLITRPVFEALFSGYSFAASNPISQAMQAIVEQLERHHLDAESDTLAAFYESVRTRAEGVTNAEGRQKIVVELYDKFFRKAFPRLTERLGIVYTPVEIVDFILRSVDHLLHQEFGQRLTDEGVHLIDPFTGTGTFITRLLQSGLIAPADLPRKYATELHANEMVLLAYYIAAVNIESAYHAQMGGDYRPFEGICLTDTFQMYEKGDLVSQALVNNSDRRERQKAAPISVIVGNPPYSVGQGSANDDNQNVAYPGLDGRITATYAAASSVAKVKALYDSYIRGIRWASDRIGERGIIGFVTNAGFLDTQTGSGVRRCLAEEFSSLYVFHLRGNARTSGEQRRKESGNAFGEGSRAPIAISFLVKNPTAAEQGRILFHDIGDYLTREEKLAKVARLGSTAAFGTPGSEGAEAAWQAIVPDEHGDWLKQRDDSFSQHIVMGDKKSAGLALFGSYSQGINTTRDDWGVNSSLSAQITNSQRLIANYNSEVARKIESPTDYVVRSDRSHIKWAQNLLGDLGKLRTHEFKPSEIRRSLYRPYARMWCYQAKELVWSRYLMPRIFPDQQSSNLVIGVTGLGDRGFSVLIADAAPDFQTLFNGQHFPLYLYEEEGGGAASDEEAGEQTELLPAGEKKWVRRDAITDAGLAHFAAAYPGQTLTKEELFYYTYGLLHAPSYREKYADNLGKELPRIPRVATYEAFCAFRDAGRALAALHLNFDSESVPMWPATLDTGGKPLTDAHYRVEKMRYAKDDKTTVLYNAHITVRGLPLEAQEYVVNGKPALDWVIERQGVRTDKDSGIVNDANDFATETMGNAKYPLELLLRVATVSVQTMKIVKGLPEV